MEIASAVKTSLSFPVFLEPFELDYNCPLPHASRRVGPEAVIAWAQRLAKGDSLHVQMLSYGNLSTEEATGEF